jgi:hypothetical protein
MKKWEYKIIVFKEPISDNHLEMLDKLGGEGWELVAIVPVGRGAFGETSCSRFYFKREIRK